MMDDLHQMPVQHPVAGGPPPLPSIVLPDRDWDHMTLDWAQYQDKWERSEDGTYYALRFVYYATNILSRNHQYMNIFVSAAYLHADGTVNEKGTCNGYTARTAPIILVNGCAGWMSSTPMEAMFDYLREGFVHISVGARSRDLGPVGKAPSACVDQKAAVRMLRLHDGMIPGDKEKIISCGGSGGGQMSSILGATGNMPDYFPYLYEIGAAGLERNANGSYTSTIRDDIFASQCYCPIADIDNADMAYAWQRFDDPNIQFEDFGTPGLQRLSPFQQEYQRDLAKAYGTYLNGLGLQNEDGAALTLTDDLRGGSYYQQILQNISDALNKFLAEKTGSDGRVTFEEAHGFGPKETVSYPSLEAYLATLKDTEQWLRRDETGFHVTDLPGFCQGTGLKRGKSVPGFDTFHCKAENNAFGNAGEDAVHFSAADGAVLKENLEKYRTLHGFEACDAAGYIADSAREDLKRQTYLMNATHILLDNGRGKVKSDFAKHWRTRNGTADEHTAFTVAYNLCMAAKMAGAEVDYALIWNAGHGDVDGDGTGSFAQWVHDICK
ncbi:MAG: hypothetical protein IJ206_05775 [Oscillospiraceae bacterium]|nr:hypothetical protein [Oscillospiraceae bacterium]